MWITAFGVLFLLAGILLIIWMLNRAQAAELMRQRLATSDTLSDEKLVIRRSPIVRRWRWLVVAVGGVAGVMVWLFAPWPEPYTAALAVMSTMLLWQLEAWWLQRRISGTEQQLADSIDLMVAAVKSGASLQGALESAMENSGKPWRNELTDLIVKIRYGDDPIDVFTELSERLPLETVRLFAQTLAVNWSVGGQLSLALANVGRTIRDRLELNRRMQAMTTQARLSVMSVILVTYFIGALMWRNDPERMGEYLGSLVGQGLVTTAMVLQAIGIVWISHMSTPRF